MIKSTEVSDLNHSATGAALNIFYCLFMYNGVGLQVEGGASVARGTNVYINNPGYMTKMATTPIHGKKTS